ncbi:effector-associated constant component EACC1 [Actinacidiphila acididurans]|uniref:Uncharacterized protein n=1 Tax=Actinacidiphila acididurans TaxID=2784346 RepID=A0ABS2U028_9ACTN|nr:hypothetical protein [Actinacidiphila acididurans]MBM9508953.1 hypothetical protein [Actinacidiphila acididurans]
MRLQIRAVDQDGARELRELYHWLRAEEDAPEEIRLVRGDPPLGPAVGSEVIDLVLTHSVAVANLTMAYASWHRARPRRAAGFTFTRMSDGRSVTVPDGSDDSVRLLLAALAAPPPPGTAHHP